MKTAAALELVAIIAQAVNQAHRDGKDSIDLMNSARALDDEARSDLVQAIADAEED